MKKFKDGILSISFSLTLCLIMFFSSSFNVVSAQDSTTAKKWNFLTDFYLMFPYMDGETGKGDLLSVPVDAKPGDIFSKLKMAAMLYFEAKTDKWAITSDLVYMNLHQTVTPGIVYHSGEVIAKEFIWEPAGLYRIVPFWEVGIGGRITSLSTDIDARKNVFPAGTEAVTASGSKTWFDPVLITRLSADINDKWLFQVRGDVGGFGIGSDLTWQIQAYSGYRFTKVFQLTAGYRVLSNDYDKGEGSERFVFNVKQFGPVIRFGFNF
jgi:hypothetical protein